MTMNSSSSITQTASHGGPGIQLLTASSSSSSSLLRQPDFCFVNSSSPFLHHSHFSLKRSASSSNHELLHHSVFFFLRSFASATASSNPLPSLARPCVCSRLCCYCHRNPRPEDRDLVSKSLTSEWLISFAADSRPFSLTKPIFTSHRKDGGASFLQAVPHFPLDNSLPYAMACNKHAEAEL
ncbi:unnamed protein product [Sphagnum balticum]